MKIRFDHMYTMDQNFKFREKLQHAGFRLRDYEVEHPGQFFCRFIQFSEMDGRKQYLEFIHIGRGGLKWKIPGLSLTSDKSLEALAKKLEKKVPLEFEHKNYEWKKNDKDRLPGWNFAYFRKHSSQIFIWLTEYEAWKKRKKAKAKDSRHPNGAYKIVELNMSLAPRELALLTLLLGKPQKDVFQLPDGRLLRFKKAKRSRIDSVVIATKSLKKMVQNFEWDSLVTHQGKPGVLICNPNTKMWDVILV